MKCRSDVDGDTDTQKLRSLLVDSCQWSCTRIVKKIHAERIKNLIFIQTFSGGLLTLQLTMSGFTQIFYCCSGLGVCVFFFEGFS